MSFVNVIINEHGNREYYKITPFVSDSPEILRCFLDESTLEDDTGEGTEKVYQNFLCSVILNDLFAEKE